MGGASDSIWEVEDGWGGGGVELQLEDSLGYKAKWIHAVGSFILI